MASCSFLSPITFKLHSINPHARKVLDKIPQRDFPPKSAKTNRHGQVGNHPLLSSESPTPSPMAALHQLRLKLDMCSKRGDVTTALSLYDTALSQRLNLDQYHYNVLLYLCSSAANGTVEESQDFARKRGFEIYEKMCTEGVPLSENAFTSVARLAMSMNDGDLAFEMVKKMQALGISPKLRSYTPALLAYCNNNDVDKAFEVEKHMNELGVLPEENELEALLGVSVRMKRSEKVYYLLHKMRTNVREVSNSVAEIIEEWFKSSNASRVGKRKWDVKMVRKAMERGGGGWHGLGWLGKGKWKVERVCVDGNGVCRGCGEKLVTVDLDPSETEEFARLVAEIASKREKSSSFQKFQRWLDYYGPFEAVVDAANVGLFSQRRFSLSKVNAVVNAIRQKLPSKKWPLIILHNRRLTGQKMVEPMNEKLIEKWENADAIYATPTGSNDDWYWLYAAIKCKSLLITNDEMRDHLFQILGNDFFPRWKERHQVRFGYEDGSFNFRMPPPCSIVIQESEKGHWHIPISEDQEESSSKERIWLCITRDTSLMKVQQHSSVGLKKKSLEKNSSRAKKDEKINTSSERQIANSSFPKSHSIISRIEAAEKSYGCIIDYQI